MMTPLRHHLAAPTDVGRLANGRPVYIRQFIPRDTALYRSFLSVLSAESRYNRLFTPRPLSKDLVEELTRADAASRMTLIATIVERGEERMIGEALLSHDGQTDTAEFAMAVLDEWHGLGLGSWLMRRLIGRTYVTGMRCLVSQTLATNDKMLGLARKSGFDLRSQPGCASVVDLTRYVTAADVIFKMRVQQDDEAA